MSTPPFRQARPSLAPSALALPRFAPDFLWGAATAAYQIEGAVDEGGRSPSIWDEFAARPGKTYQGQSGAVACDHYHRMPDDVALMADLGLGAYRFSIAWPRILPAGVGDVNPAGLDFYDRLVDALLVHGITPMATLYHWDLPVALEARGGWLNRDTAHAFADYADVVMRRLGDRVPWWLTLNEPWCSAWLGYGTGQHAPGRIDTHGAMVAAHHLLLAHGLAMARMRSLAGPGTRLGITLNLAPVIAGDDRPETAEAVGRLDAFTNRWFLDPIFRGHYPEHPFDTYGAPSIQPGDLDVIAAPIDHLGVNYYERAFIRGHRRRDCEGVEIERVTPVPGSAYTSMGWEIHPEGLTELLLRLHRDYTPERVIVTENGAAFDDHIDPDGGVHDPLRRDYLQRHVAACAAAVQHGVPLEGYFVWSLMDNFEWAEGYTQRFGIVYVDFPTQQRIPKDSARWYAHHIAAQRRDA